MQARTWDKESIIALITRQDELGKRAVVRAIKALYARQTADEQATCETRHRNGMGFNGPDAAFLSDIARKLPRYNDNMTPRQVAKAQRMLPKYWRQLLEIANDRLAAEEAAAEPSAPAPQRRPAAAELHGMF